jgi:hypothetical protein
VLRGHIRNSSHQDAVVNAWNENNRLVEVARREYSKKKHLAFDGFYRNPHKALKIAQTLIGLPTNSCDDVPTL